MNTLTLNGSIRALNQPLDDLIEALIASQHKSTTRHTYRQNIRYFADYLLHGLALKGSRITLSDQEVKRVMGEFLALEQNTAIAYVVQYQNELIEADYTPNTISIRIASIRALTRFAHKKGFCSFIIEDLQNIGNEVYRDTTGVSKDIFAQIVSNIDLSTQAGKRDYAILRLLWDNALRRSEISNLDIGDFNPTDSTLKIQGKGKHRKQVVYLAPQTVTAIAEWLKVKKYDLEPHHPLFTSLANNTKGHRITGKSIYCTVRKYADPVLADKMLSPHRVRHSSITAVLDASDGNVRMAQKLSRHKSLDVLSKYDDNRVALQKEAAIMLADMI
jgi:integrase/recombinase XerC